MNKYNLERFVKAQDGIYETALREIKNGEKHSHWIWYIFPQFRGLGTSQTAYIYGIENLEEAVLYLEHELLSSRLYEITEALLKLPTNNPVKVLGTVDALKLRSCMTLFAAATDVSSVFCQVLEKFYGGSPDQTTIRLLK